MSSNKVGVCSLFVPTEFCHDDVKNQDTFYQDATEARFDLLRRYANLHGYRCECVRHRPDDDHEDQTGWWYKDVPLLNMWDECDWILYTDIDTHMMCPQWKLERFINRACDRHWLIGRTGKCRLQLGSFLIRCCRRAKTWLTTTYQTRDRGLYEDGFDVPCGCDVISNMGDWDRVLTLDPMEFEATVGRYEFDRPVFIHHYPAPSRKQRWLRDLPYAQSIMEWAEARRD